MGKREIIPGGKEKGPISLEKRNVKSREGRKGAFFLKRGDSQTKEDAGEWEGRERKNGTGSLLLGREVNSAGNTVIEAERFPPEKSGGKLLRLTQRETSVQYVRGERKKSKRFLSRKKGEALEIDSIARTDMGHTSKHGEGEGLSMGKGKEDLEKRKLPATQKKKGSPGPGTIGGTKTHRLWGKTRASL